MFDLITFGEAMAVIGGWIVLAFLGAIFIKWMMIDISKD